MDIMFEVFLTPAGLSEDLLSADTLREVQTQVMTWEEVQRLGLLSIPDDPQGRDRRFIRVAAENEGYVQRFLELNGDVALFRIYQLDS